jgi:hypothetical protein
VGRTSKVAALGPNSVPKPSSGIRIELGPIDQLMPYDKESAPRWRRG